MTRVYIPVTLAMLERLVADEALTAANATAFAVTPALREAYAYGDDEELAAVALRDAALASLRLLGSDEPLARRADDTDEPLARRADDTDEPLARRADDTDELLARRAEDTDEVAVLRPRRAVLVADVDEARARPELDDSVVRLAGPVGLDQVVCVYVDNAAAEPAVAAAVEAVDAADLGDEDAELLVGDAQDHDLAWYGVQELAFLLELW